MSRRQRTLPFFVFTAITAPLFLITNSLPSAITGVNSSREWAFHDQTGLNGGRTSFEAGRSWRRWGEEPYKGHTKSFSAVLAGSGAGVSVGSAWNSTFELDTSPPESSAYAAAPPAASSA